jgi:putative oxidoreductase
MKKYLLLVTALFIAAAGCVQKSYKKTVVITVKTGSKKNIQTVGIRGAGKPLSWREDLPMQPIVKDSLYTATITAVTGYTFTEIKFTIDGEFELQNKPNRRVVFSQGDTTFYNAVFNAVQ